MKKTIVSLLLIALAIISFGQKHAFTYKQNIVAGSVMTGIGDVTLATGLTCLLLGIEENNAVTSYDAYGYPQYMGDGSPLIITGSVLMAAGAALTIAGPILLVRGIKQRKAFKAGTSMSFTPMKPIFADKFPMAIRQQKLASITFTL